MTNPIAQIAEREFGDNEFMIRVKKNITVFGGHFTPKDTKQHFKKAKEAFE